MTVETVPTAASTGTVDKRPAQRRAASGRWPVTASTA
jgi:hypothetical protein